MPIYYDSSGGEDLPASIDLRVGDLVRMSARGIADHGDREIARCLGLFTPGLIVQAGQFVPAGRPSTVIISAEKAGQTDIQLMIGPHMGDVRRRVVTIVVTSLP